MKSKYNKVMPSMGKVSASVKGKRTVVGSTMAVSGPTFSVAREKANTNKSFTN